MTTSLGERGKCSLFRNKCMVFVNLGALQIVLFSEVKMYVFVNLGPWRCVLIREVSSFQRVKCRVFVNLVQT